MNNYQKKTINSKFLEQAAGQWANLVLAQISYQNNPNKVFKPYKNENKYAKSNS